MRFIGGLLLCVLSLSAQDKSKRVLDKAAFEAYIRHLLVVVAEVQVKIDDPKPSDVPGLDRIDVHFTFGPNTRDDVFYISKDGNKIIRGEVYDLHQNPFQSDLDKLKTDLSPSFGTPGAPVVLVVFSDFQCPNCKEEAKTLRDNLKSGRVAEKVRLYFKDYPLVTLHPWAKAAAIAGRCVFRQSPTAFWQYHDWMYEHQGEINGDNLKSKVEEFARTVSDLDSLQFGRCVDTKATEAEVDKEMAEGKALRVDGTPTMFLNGRRLVGNYPWANLEQLINSETDYQKTAKNAGEKCCEVKIPSPLNK
jgi:protein-disulfide isomerase